MKLIDLEAPYKVEVELNGHKCSISVIGKLVDAVPVVRCKDCEVLITRTQAGKSVLYCPFINHYTCETFFCAKGRRGKDDETD